MRTINHFIAGNHDGGGASGAGGRIHDVWNPSTGDVQARVPLGDAALLDRAVAAAKAVQPEWAATNPQKRARIMFAFKELVEAHKQELAELLSSEHGKVVDDAHGDVQRGLEVIEYACGIPQVLKGEYTLGAGPGIDVYSTRQPLGIGAGITPFNFPAMIPMWMFGVAIAAGNAFILKPSERDPSSVPVRLGRTDAGSGRARRASCKSCTATRKWSMRSLITRRYRGDQLRRFVGHRALCLPNEGSTGGQACPGDGRREKPRHRHA